METNKCLLFYQTKNGDYNKAFNKRSDLPATIINHLFIQFTLHILLKYNGFYSWKKNLQGLKIFPDWSTNLKAMDFC